MSYTVNENPDKESQSALVTPLIEKMKKGEDFEYKYPDSKRDHHIGIASSKSGFPIIWGKSRLHPEQIVTIEDKLRVKWITPREAIALYEAELDKEPKDNEELGPWTVVEITPKRENIFRRIWNWIIWG